MNRTLESVDLQDNKIRVFPPFFGNTTLKRLDLRGNEGLVSPPHSVANPEDEKEDAGRAVVEYFRDLEFYGGGSLRRVNVCVVGHGGVGKTTLVRSVLLGKHLLSPREFLVLFLVLCSHLTLIPLNFFQRFRIGVRKTSASGVGSEDSNQSSRVFWWTKSE